jgi:hypothetical protein
MRDDPPSETVVRQLYRSDQLVGQMIRCGDADSSGERIGPREWLRDVSDQRGDVYVRVDGTSINQSRRGETMAEEADMSKEECRMR